MNNLKPTAISSLHQGIFWANFGVIFAFASVFLLKNDFTNSQIGFVIALGSAFSALLQPLFGKQADHSPKLIIRKQIIIVSLLSIIAAGLLLLPGKNFWLTAVLYGMLVMFLQVITPLTYSLSMFFINKGININFGVARGAGSLTYSGICILLGELINKYDENVIIYMTILLYAFLIFSTLCFRFKNQSENNDISQEEIIKDDNFLMSYKNFALLLLGIVFIFISHNSISSYMYQIITYHGYGTVEMGKAIFICSMAELPFNFCFYLVNKFFRSGLLLKVSGIFFAIKAIVLYMAGYGDLNTIYVAMALQMFGFGLFSSTSVYYVNHCIEESKRVRGQSYMNMANTVGAVLGSIFGGQILDKYNAPGLLLLSVITSVLGAIIVFFIAQKGNLYNEKA